ncbi:hypothetical protein LBMAG33_0740 [Candidatus Levyibacteriota bacterium]|nr:hypothetical protein [Candidatus Levybacteria bacterium]MSU26256.1 D-alanyl-D-alanine carboxypeptidase [Candidatus Levybacteria bacterium]GDX61764.1 hypothetical protein LBMAG33_0740 [Candidatus Levybacteria bacterium]
MKDYTQFINKNKLFVKVFYPVKKYIKKNREYSILFFLILLFIPIKIKEKQLQLNMANPFVNLPVIVTQEPYPIIKSVLGASSSKFEDNNSAYPSLSAQGAAVIDNDSQVVLFSKNYNLKFSMASTTKIMTAITAIKHYSMRDKIIVYADNISGARVGFKKGDEVSFEDMLYGLLLPSGNDAAVAIAQNYPGGQEAFVKKMNKNAKDFYLNSIHYTDPTGLEDMGDYANVIDLARLGSIAMKNSVFAKVVGTKNKEIKTINTGKSYNLYNLNKLLGSDGVVGIKTGFTDEAGEVLVTSKIYNDHMFIIVVMKSMDRFGDTKKIMSFLEGNVDYFSPNKFY